MKTDLSIIGEYALLGLNVILVIALLIIIFNLRKLIKGHIVEANKDLLDHSEKNNAHSMNDILRYEKNISDLKWQIESITFDFDVYRSMHDDFPFPYWLKNKDGIMLWVSKRYEEIFLEPLGLCAEDYIGNKDEKIWGKEIGEVFSRNDHHVINTGKYIRADENKKDDKNPILSNWIFYKYPIIIGDGIQCVGGIALPKNKKK